MIERLKKEKKKKSEYENFNVVCRTWVNERLNIAPVYLQWINQRFCRLVIEFQIFLMCESLKLDSRLF